QMSTSRTVGVGRGERQTLLTNARGRRTVSTLQTNRPHRGRGWMMTRMGQQYGTVRQRALPGVSYVPAELGRGAHQTGDELLAALSVPSAGQLFDLDAGRWPGMPVLPVHPPFVMTTYRTPGRAVRTPDAATETGVTTELIVSSAHTGTHIDALCHVTEGSRWFGGGLAEHLGRRCPRPRPSPRSCAGACCSTSRRCAASRRSRQASGSPPRTCGPRPIVRGSSCVPVMPC